MIRSGLFLGIGIGIACAQQHLQMGARLILQQSSLISSTDKAVESWMALRPTYRAGMSGFFLWGWNPYLSTGVEIAYQGAGQSYYGAGLNGQTYQAQISLNYLSFGIPIALKKTWEKWGLIAQIAPSLNFLTRSNLTYQGDSLPSGNLYSTQIIQNVLNYLTTSTNSDDQLLTLRLFRRGQWGLSAAGGVQTRLAPDVWILVLLHYTRLFGDSENKGYRLTPESPPIYNPSRAATYQQAWGFQIGILYEVKLR